MNQWLLQVHANIFGTARETANSRFPQAMTAFGSHTKGKHLLLWLVIPSIMTALLIFTSFLQELLSWSARKNITAGSCPLQWCHWLSLQDSKMLQILFRPRENIFSKQMGSCAWSAFFFFQWITELNSANTYCLELTEMFPTLSVTAPSKSKSPDVR